MKKVFKKREEIVTRKIADEIILVPVKEKLADMQRIFSLNPVGEFIWEQLDGKKDLQDISKGVQEIFDVDREQAMADIGEFISELIKEGLISEG